MKFLLWYILCVFVASVHAQEPESKLKEKNIVLPAPGKPIANYVSAVRTGNLVFLAGKGPQKTDGSYITGKVGKDLTIEQGYDAARLTAINQLSAIKAEIGGPLSSQYADQS